jgi:hypothetical protein
MLPLTRVFVAAQGLAPRSSAGGLVGIDRPNRRVVFAAPE